ncbi:hypothetical protein GCM10023339_82130 [Alloalcanivorax gelatiniphagus]
MLTTGRSCCGAAATSAAFADAVASAATDSLDDWLEPPSEQPATNNVAKIIGTIRFLMARHSPIER